MKQKKLNLIIWAVSIVVPVLVAVLLFYPVSERKSLIDVTFLPTLNATLNSLTSVLLVSSLFAIKKGNIQLHKNLMFSALSLGAVFLVSYVVYHSFGPKTIFGDVNGDLLLSDNELTLLGTKRTFYLVVLISHILLSMVVLPCVLFSFYFALTNNIEKHKKLVRFTFPIWLYVSVTGVVVYLLIKPYY